MFGRRRHAAPAPAAPVPQLTDAQILEIVHRKVSELIGASGEWTVVRRAADDTDALFHSILAQSVSVGITAALAEARLRLENGEPVSAPQHLAPAVVATPATAAEHVAEPEPDTVAAVDAPAVEADGPVAFTWEPAPITVWTDLRKPVTDTFTAIEERPAA
ncbi:hypothetical protein [Leifsonia sp. AG29]|uniref:hypothetical protein n=1 Tax=Leifsonia sp. AG29 TaxID=2598860 RepID=UPI00131E9EDF|nr:hypothetical protein [Leifsonia sp. AG29]